MWVVSELLGSEMQARFEYYWRAIRMLARKGFSPNSRVKRKKELANMAYENTEAKRDAEVKLRHLPHCGRPKRVIK